jgi:hypothetical protein
MALQTVFAYQAAKWESNGQNGLKQNDGLSRCYIREEPYNIPEERFLLSGYILSLVNTRGLHEFHPTAEAAQKALEAHRLELIKSFMQGFALNPL